VLLLISLIVLVQGVTKYHGNTVLRVELENNQQKEFIASLNLDVWSRDSNLALGINDVMVNDKQRKAIERQGIHYDVFIDDVQALIDEETEYHANVVPRDFYDAYHNYSEIVAYYQTLANTHPTLITFIANVGNSLEGRAIPAIHVTAGTATTKKKIFFNGGQHAREWIAPATVTYIVEQLLVGYATDAAIKRLLDNIEFVVVPLVNADGYSFTWTNTRLWRKNRRPNTGGSYGVDLNRNWDDHWGGEGSSSNPTSDTYHGTAPFSEPETKAVSDYVLRTGPFLGAIDYHSYSQLVLRPYGWTTALPPNDAAAKAVGDGIAAAIRATTGLVYTSEPSWQLYYTAGTAQDWYYAPAKIPISFTIELRDTGNYGFQLPATQIRPTGQENWEAFKFFANYILANITA